MRRLFLISLIVWFIIGAIGCHKPGDYELNKGFTAEAVLNLFVDSDTNTILADGFSTIRIKATIPKEADPDKKDIQLETTAGTWKENGKKKITVTVNAEGEAAAYLQSTLIPEENVRIQGKIAYIIQEINVTFQRAYSEYLEVDPGTLALKATFDVNTTVTAYLKRSTGLPSMGTPVTFSAVDDTRNPIGMFRSIKSSDANGAATAVFTVGNTSYRGSVTITASTGKQDGGIVVGNASIIIIE